MTNKGTDSHSPGWGLLPEAAIALLRKREWDNTARLKTLLIGEREFPIVIPLRPPSGPQALSELAHFQNFCESWKRYPHQRQVVKESRTYRTLDLQQVPVRLEIESVQSLVTLLGGDAVIRHKHWCLVIASILDAPFAMPFQRELFVALVAKLPVLDCLTTNQSNNIVSLLPQLSKNLGAGCYLRALPVKGIDTKFVEEHQGLLHALLDVIFTGAITDAGGLSQWLGCKPNPKGWLFVKPLCEEAMTALGGLPILQLPLDVLLQKSLPAQHILVVENLESGLALPSLPDTIAVMGAGRNLHWLSAHWLTGKQVAYWGDIDTWGLTLLSDARAHCKHLTALMMDTAAVLAHQDRMVAEPEPAQRLPATLTDEESQLYSDLLSGRFQHGRLEQERLSQDYVRTALRRWIGLESNFG